MLPGDTLKWCSGCQTEKPPTEFHKNKARADGLQNYCKACAKSARNASYHKHKVKYAERNSRWHKNRNLKANYGISIETFELMAFEQNNQCVICRTELISPRVDQNRKTKEIRALLCSSCSAGVILFEESSELLERAASYLQAYEHLNDYLSTYNDKGSLKRPLAVELD